MSQQPDNIHHPSLSLLAVCAFVLALLSFVFSIITGLPAIILGALAIYRIRKNPEHSFGLGYAKAGIKLALIGSALTAILLALIVPYLGRARELAGHSSSCAANLRGIVISMQAYAHANNGHYPIGAPPSTAGKYSSMLNLSTGEKERSLASDFLFNRTMAGNIYTPLWMMVLNEQISTKSFLCHNDPFATDAAAELQNADGHYYASMQKPWQLSFSIAYPWYKNPQTTTIEPAPWWHNTNDPTIPVMCDMAPLNGTGSPRRDVASTQSAKEPPLLNMGFNHGGAGMNVTFADGHVEWTRTPRVGQNQDHIFTSGNTPGFPPRVSEIERITTTQPPYDTVMVPMREGKWGDIR